MEWFLKTRKVWKSEMVDHDIYNFVSWSNSVWLVGASWLITADPVRYNMTFNVTYCKIYCFIILNKKYVYPNIFSAKLIYSFSALSYWIMNKLNGSSCWLFCFVGCSFKGMLPVLYHLFSILEIFILEIFIVHLFLYLSLVKFIMNNISKQKKTFRLMQKFVE